MTKEQFIDELKKINISLTSYQLEQFDKYFKVLVEWNEKMNLTSITEEEEVYEKHFYDCLLVSQSYDFNNQKICDVGAGAGFPSVPLKIVYPDLDITIVDSLDKRIKFLNVLSDELNLDNFRAVSQRAEEFAQDNREAYDLVLARAVARLNILVELCLPLVKVDGYFVALKGKQALEELDEAKLGIEKLGANLISKDKYQLISDYSTRYMLKYKKVKPTDKKYPRNYSQIKKKPL
ncbi:16S rRNA (guanine527-N7)-methyltransferase [Bacilli bacterium PM5-3]|nr:16S rRNA (guanine527-N7)-methyltransferase [Bacilli bacterium PM5-3]